jgi:hypothetical protein
MSAIKGIVGASAVVVDTSNFAYPISVTVIPGSGNTSKCEFSTTAQAGVNPASANWQVWPDGTAGVVSAITSDYVNKITALRFTRITGSSTDNYEIVS